MQVPNPLIAWINADSDYFLKTSAVAKLQHLLKFSQIRFKCAKPATRKKIDLTTAKNNLGIQAVKYFTGQTGSFPKACHSFDVLPDDNSGLSKECSNWGRMAGKYYTGTWSHDPVHGGFESRVSYCVFFTRSAKHFNLEPNRWECDDFLVAPKAEDYWKLFVR